MQKLQLIQNEPNQRQSRKIIKVPQLTLSPISLAIELSSLNVPNNIYTNTFFVTLSPFPAYLFLLSFPPKRKKTNKS